MTKIAYLLLGVVFGFSSYSAQAAGLYVEPYVGYETGELDQGTQDDDTKGMVYGFKLGYMSGSLGWGFYYGSGSVEVDFNTEDDFELTDMGGFLIYDMGQARIWATYIFDAEGELDTAGTKYTKGTGLAFGVGFKISSGLSLNIEKIDREYKKVGGNTVNPEHTLSGLVFSVSLPLP